MTSPPIPFTLHVPDADITDLKARLARTRLPDQTPGPPWAYGTDVAYLRTLIDYWRNNFDWRAHEAHLNAFPQFKVSLHGNDVHYLQVAGKGPDPKPLLLMHGWPGSVFEFLELIPQLTDPAQFGGDARDAFTVIAPSLPGYGLSFRPNQKRLSIADMADCFTDLMVNVLGHKKFAAQGGDWGAHLCAALGVRHPDRLVGIHVNMLSLRPDQPLPANPTAEEKLYGEEMRVWLDGGERLQRDPRHPPADTRIRPDGFASRACRLDRRKVSCLDGTMLAITKLPSTAIACWPTSRCIGSQVPLAPRSGPITTACMAAGPSRMAPPSQCQRDTPRSPRKSVGRRDLSLDRRTPISVNGRPWTKAVTSQPLSSRRPWPPTCVRSFANCARPSDISQPFGRADRLITQLSTSREKRLSGIYGVVTQFSSVQDGS